MIKIVIFIICSIIAIGLTKLYIVLKKDEEENERNKSFLLMISRIIMLEFSFMFILGVLGFIFSLIGPINFNFSIDLLFTSFFITFFMLVPLFIAAICGKRYTLGKNNGKLTACWIWGIISLMLNLYIFYEVVGNFYTQLEFVLTYLPNILFIIACGKAHNKLENKKDN